MNIRAEAVDIRPEIELLFCCARRFIDSAAREKIITLLQGSINWPFLLRMALNHGVIPLIYQNLNSSFSEAVPNEVLVHLQGFYKKNARRNLYLTGELLKLIDILKTHDISSISYTGPILAVSVYANIGLRQFSDLDILIRERDVTKAIDLLTSQGYRSITQLTDPQEATFTKRRGARGFVHEGRKVTVDLHWGVSLRKKDFSYPIDDERFRERLTPVQLAGETVYSLSPEDLLQVLCIHGCRHAWEQLKWICDVAELTRTYRELDWESVIKQASKLGHRRMLFLGLNLARVLLGATLPKKVLQEMMTDPVVTSLTEKIQKKSFSECTDLSDSESHAFYLELRERSRDRISYLVRTAVTPNEKDYSCLSLPKFLFFLYYLIRPIRLFGKFVFGKYSSQLLKYPRG